MQSGDNEFFSSARMKNAGIISLLLATSVTTLIQKIRETPGKVLVQSRIAKTARANTTTANKPAAK
jgi:hypothetical protein